MNTLRTLTATCGVLLALAACGSETAVPGDDPGGALDWDGSWVLSSGTYDGAPLGLVDSHPITLVLDGDAAGGISACNHYSGTVTHPDGGVRFGQLAGTEMACMPARIMDLEQDYLTALAAVHTATRNGVALTLTGDGVTLAFELEPPVPTADLVGTTWVLDSLVMGDVVSSVLGTPSLRLAGDGTMTGSTGCRTFEGTWTEEGSRIVVADLVTTDEACAEDRQAQDDHVLGVLGDGFTAQVEEDRLTASGADGLGLLFRQE